jgi:hypothetical protein
MHARMCVYNAAGMTGSCQMYAGKHNVNDAAGMIGFMPGVCKQAICVQFSLCDVT